jgi:uncharacterized membrane protein
VRRTPASRVLDLLAPLLFLDYPDVAAGAGTVSDDEIMRIVKKRCVACHSQNPTHTMFLNQPPPKDIALDSIEEVRALANRIRLQVVELKRMPLGNETAMEERERAEFAAWIGGK